jgi:hypothetical protein
LNFYKEYNKPHFKELEEEVSFIQEIYFNCAFGDNQLTTNYVIDWEQLEHEIDLQEYFFNIRTDFFKGEHIIKQKKWTKLKNLNEKVKEKIHTINSTFNQSYAHLESAVMRNLASFTESMLPSFGLIQNDRKQKRATTCLQIITKLGLRVKDPSQKKNKKHNVEVEKLNEEEEKRRYEGNSDYMVREFDLQLHVPEVADLENALLNLKAETDGKNIPEDHRLYLKVKTGYIVKRAANLIVELDKITKPDESTKDMLKRFKATTGDLLFDCKIYLSMFSKKSICSLIQAMPETAIEELIKVENVLEVYFTFFRGLVKVFYRWMRESTAHMEYKQEDEKRKFYKLASTLMTFFNKLINLQLKKDSSCFQKELLYFDFLFSMFHYSGGSDLMTKYSSCNFASFSSSSELEISIQKICSHQTDFFKQQEEDIFSTEKGEYLYLAYLLYSLGHASNRFFITDTSLTLKTNMASFKRDLVNFLKDQNSNHSMSESSSRDSHFGGLPPMVNNHLKDLRRDHELVIANNTFDKKIESAAGSIKLENDMFYGLYHLVVNLQFNLFFKLDESSLDVNYCTSNQFQGKHFADDEDFPRWKMETLEHMDLLKNNLLVLISDSFKAKYNADRKAFLLKSTFQQILLQSATFLRKYHISNDLDKFVKIVKSEAKKKDQDFVNDIGRSIGVYYMDETKKQELNEMDHISKLIIKIKEFVSNDELSSPIELKEANDAHELNSTDSALEKIARITEKIRISTKQSKSDLSETDYLKNAFEALESIIDQNKTRSYRKSVHRDENALHRLSECTQFSRKYTDGTINDKENYYRPIFLGKVEMEVDPRELRAGLARSFIKVFNKMLLVQSIDSKFAKIGRNLSNEASSFFDFLYENNEFADYDVNNWRKPDPHPDGCFGKGYESSHEALKFLYSIQTNYFYNEVYFRSIRFFEKMVDEIPEIKKWIYLESMKNRKFSEMKFLANDEYLDFLMPKRGRPQHLLFPYLQNLNFLSIHLSTCLTNSIFFKEEAGILTSNLFLVNSLLNNLNLESFQEYKKLYVRDEFIDPMIPFFKSEPLKAKPKKVESNLHRGSSFPKPNNQDIIEEEEIQDLNMLFLIQPWEYERDHYNLAMSICGRLQHLLERFKLSDKARLAEVFRNKNFLTLIPIVTQWIQFLSNSLYIPNQKDAEFTFIEANLLMFYYYKKIMSPYLLKMLFLHTEINYVEIVYLKKAITGLVYKLSKNKIIMEDMLKSDVSNFRAIYEYTVYVTRIHVASHLKENQFIDKAFKKMLLCKRLKRKKTSENDEEEEESTLSVVLAKNLQEYNTRFFGGCNYIQIISSADLKSQDPTENADKDELIDSYTRSDNRDLGFQFINSLVKIMNYIESTSTSWRLWSNKKESARTQFEIEESNLSKSRLSELKIVYLLSKITKQIEVVDQDGIETLITFRKYPEIYTLESLDPLSLISEFEFEDFKRDVCKIIPELAIKTSVQYVIMNRVGFLYGFMRSDTSKKHPQNLWLMSLVLNLIIFIGYQNYKYNSDTHDLRNNSFKMAEQVMAYAIMVYSGITIILWITTRYIAVKINKMGTEVAADNESQFFDSIKLAGIGRIIRKLTRNPYFMFVKSMVLSADILCLCLYFVFAALGWWIHPILYVGAVCMFAFFNQTAKNLLSTISSNWLDIMLTLLMIFITAYIYSILQYYYLFEDFGTDNFGQSKPCISLYTCYMAVINYGIRMGGGLGEITDYVSEDSDTFGGQFVFNITFFFFINIIFLNMLFGIIIDGFGSLREKEWEKDEVLSNFCLVCSIQKTEFEAKGVNFDLHTNLQHNLEDYVAYMIRLYINASYLEHDLDYFIFSKITRFNISWFPNLESKFLVQRPGDRVEEKANQKIIAKLDVSAESIEKVKERIDQIKYALGMDVPQLSKSPFTRSMNKRFSIFKPSNVTPN